MRWVPVNPAIDEAPAAACAASPINGLDQTARRVLADGNGGDECDIGAVEYANPTYPTEIVPTPGAAGLNGYDGCSLVEAIITANTDVPTGGCLDVGGADTILLAGNTYSYTVRYDSIFLAALPVIRSEITIEGNNSTIERDSGAATNFRIMRVHVGGNLTLNQVTLTGGNAGFGSGGALSLQEGEVTVNDSTITGNTALMGGGLYVSSGGTLAINNSAISGNSASDNGGGLAAYKKDTTPTSVTVTVNDSTISGNSAQSGGGILSFARSLGSATLVTVTVNNSTISGNTATSGGGGVYNYAYEGIGPPQATITLNNSTLTGNSAAIGGGVYSLQYSGTANTYLHRSIVSGNSATVGDELVSAGGGNVYLADYNLLGDSSQTNAEAFSGASPGASDISATIDGTNPTHLSDILDTTLANNGGPTLTHALVPVSPAIDEAPAAACAASPINGLDQTGAPRAGGPGNGGDECDIGAVEYANPSYPTEIIPTPGAAGLNGYDGCSLVEAIITANTDVPTGGCLDVGGADTIALAGNTYTYTTDYDNASLTALPAIYSEITIEGNNSTIERDSGAATNFRIMRVVSGGNLTLNQVTLTGGNAGNNSGGGLFVNEGEATVNSSAITGNSAVDGGGLAVLLRGTLTLNESTISGNSASRNGGGLAAYKNFDASSIPITVTVNGSTISGNSAQSGGGLSSYARSLVSAAVVTVTINNSTISGNSATSGGGGIYNASEVEFGDPSQATIMLNNSTVTGNSAASGGGLYNLQYSGTANTYLHRSLVSGNKGTTSGDELASSGGGNIYLNDYNLLGYSDQTNADAFLGVTPGATDITATSDGTDPTPLASILNTTLADNGGDTLTHALVSDSPAIDVIAIDGSVCDPPNTTDQRGAPRANGAGAGGSACDIGAFEFASTPTAITLSNVTANSDSADPTLITLLLASLSALTLGFRRRFKRKTG
ncbi:MAG: hypothetical protein M9918_02090 [Anaerolineae bacterium]|nr:hypothetical protein [Anaerolineae bacterium]